MISSDDLARYIEQTDGISKPWLLSQLRLQKLAEQKDDMNPEEYAIALADIYEDTMNLGQWWEGIESEVF